MHLLKNSYGKQLVEKISLYPDLKHSAYGCLAVKQSEECIFSLRAAERVDGEVLLHEGALREWNGPEEWKGAWMAEAGLKPHSLRLSIVHVERLFIAITYQLTN